MLTLSLIAGICVLTGLGVAVLPWTEAELEGSVDACRALGEGALQVRTLQWNGEVPGVRRGEGAVAAG